MAECILQLCPIPETCWWWLARMGIALVGQARGSRLACLPARNGLHVQKIKYD
ncbi:hypothetical protein L9W92_12705 [Pelotomaculum terephthalicicum JT]|uniref:hypothetical protein n=1 Tax=Pelotomaculum terephthalicicum TaxID=206393 RepID=UPI001F03E47B|nr:hypothetical protein [Pelotomaculum terephthalicicum]MCG9968895.1 hypothetical protein [Pelotomaculum terephthalicicum JT]